MAARTDAQEEFDTLISKAAAADRSPSHPDDNKDYHHDRESSDRDDETIHTQRRIDETMRMPALSGGGGGGMLRLPPREFDHGRTTGVKGVIADARSFEEARRSGPLGRSSSLRAAAGARASFLAAARRQEDEESGMSVSDDDDFLERWRQQRRVELEQKGSEIRTRRTSPSVRRYGRFDEVDALGYLDAIEKVGRDTVVVVFVYDAECAVSQVISKALAPLVPKHTAVHFVRVSYEDIEFDNAGVPAILAYRNQGDLFANLTYIIDHIPADTPFDTRALETVLRNNNVL